MMRLAIALLVSALAAAPALAYENFIPLGHNYSPDDQVLPEFSGTQDQINSQTDLYETEVYIGERYQAEQDSHMKRFLNNQELEGGDYSIDY